MQNTQLEVTESASSLLTDFPPGPLDAYRKKGTFDWKKMKLLLEGDDIVKFQMKVWKTLEADSLFRHVSTDEMTYEEYHHLCFQQMKRLTEYDLLPKFQQFQNRLAFFLIASVGMYDWSLAVKYVASYGYFLTALIKSGTEKHAGLLNDAYDSKIYGCVAMTEFGHGTNIKNIRTIVTFDKQTKEFILHTPDFEASKAWIGNLGHTATHAVLFGQLFIPDGECQGVHAFVVPIRDPNTMLPYPGVTVGEMGPKIGLKGLDNGFLSFQHYRIPQDCLLNKYVNVTSDGKYISTFKEPNKQFGTVLEVLGEGRLVVMGFCVMNLRKCLPIAIRYSAIRRQFGPTDEEEVPIIEYQLQQWRLLPYVAASYVLYNSFLKLYDQLGKNYASLLSGKKTPTLMEERAELHALTCVGKSVAGWISRDAIQECREACGGHGYLQASGFGILRNDNDANCTFEGDSNVILQQTSNYLLRLYRRKLAGEELPSHLKSTHFLHQMDSILQEKFPLQSVDQVLDIEGLLGAFKWLVCYLLKETFCKLKTQLEQMEDMFTAYNSSQVFFSHTLAQAFFHHTALQQFYELSHVKDTRLASVLTRLGSLYGLWTLEKHLATMYAGGYCEGPVPTTVIRDGILKLCASLKDDAVTLVDVLAPPDFILNSTLGSSDGQVYKNLYNSITKAPGALDRPYWWKECLQQPAARSIKCKL